MFETVACFPFLNFCRIFQQFLQIGKRRGTGKAKHIPILIHATISIVTFRQADHIMELEEEWEEKTDV